MSKFTRRNVATFRRLQLLPHDLRAVTENRHWHERLEPLSPEEIGTRLAEEALRVAEETLAKASVDSDSGDQLTSKSEPALDAA